MEWFERYVKSASKFSRASITASFHREYITQDKFEDFADKLEFCQRNGVRVTINSVMVPENFDEIYKNLLYFYERGINVTLKPQSDPTASFVVDGKLVEDRREISNKFNISRMYHHFIPSFEDSQMSSSKIPTIL